ncbi:unnamed protein product [Chrysoparadoxa australica]
MKKDLTKGNRRVATLEKQLAKAKEELEKTQEAEVGSDPQASADFKDLKEAEAKVMAAQVNEKALTDEIDSAKGQRDQARRDLGALRALVVALPEVSSLTELSYALKQLYAAVEPRGQGEGKGEGDGSTGMANVLAMLEEQQHGTALVDSVPVPVEVTQPSQDSSPGLPELDESVAMPDLSFGYGLGQAASKCDDLQPADQDACAIGGEGVGIEIMEGYLEGNSGSSASATPMEEEGEGQMVDIMDGLLDDSEPEPTTAAAADAPFPKQPTFDGGTPVKHVPEVCDSNRSGRGRSKAKPKPSVVKADTTPKKVTSNRERERRRRSLRIARRSSYANDDAAASDDQDEMDASEPCTAAPAQAPLAEAGAQAEPETETDVPAPPEQSHSHSPIPKRKGGKRKKRGDPQGNKDDPGPLCLISDEGLAKEPPCKMQSPRKAARPSPCKGNREDGVEAEACIPIHQEIAPLRTSPRKPKARAVDDPSTNVNNVNGTAQALAMAAPSLEQERPATTTGTNGKAMVPKAVRRRKLGSTGTTLLPGPKPVQAASKKKRKQFKIPPAAVPTTFVVKSPPPRWTHFATVEALPHSNRAAIEELDESRVEAHTRKLFPEHHRHGVVTSCVFAAGMMLAEAESGALDDAAVNMLRCIVAGESLVVEQLTGENNGAARVRFCCYDFSAVEMPVDGKPSSVKHVERVSQTLGDVIQEKEKLKAMFQADGSLGVKGWSAFLRGLKTLGSLRKQEGTPHLEHLGQVMQAANAALGTVSTAALTSAAATFYLREFSDIDPACCSLPPDVGVTPSPLRSRLGALVSSALRFHLRQLLNAPPPSPSVPELDIFEKPQAERCTRSRIWTIVRLIPAEGVNGGAAMDGALSSVLTQALLTLHTGGVAEVDSLVSTAEAFIAASPQKGSAEQRYSEEWAVAAEDHLVALSSLQAAYRARDFFLELLSWPGISEEVEAMGGWGSVERLAMVLRQLGKVCKASNDDAHFSLMANVSELQAWLLSSSSWAWLDRVNKLMARLENLMKSRSGKGGCRSCAYIKQVIAEAQLHFPKLAEAEEEVEDSMMI